jgi:alpha/beta superfamily hydrolase
MNDAVTKVNVEQLELKGPAGTLEAILETPQQADGTRVAVVCHPHPVYGGTMTNKVVYILAKAFAELGVPTLRFNFRGVGRSTGAFDNGRGETLDALAAIEWAQSRWPQAGLWLAGFSFGGAIALRAAAQTRPERLVTVAPAIQRVDVSRVTLPTCPWLIVQGDKDELVSAESVQAWVQTLNPKPQLAVLPGVDHFFHGRLNDLRDVVVQWARTT